jgi:hypothetical protein
MKWRLALAPLFCCASFNGQMADEQQFDLETYWRKPLAEQGEPPAQWTSAECAFEAAACGACHPETFAQWQTSRHAHAFSPALVAQLLGQDAAATAECLQCHAPLAEQREAFEAARARPPSRRSGTRGFRQFLRRLPPAASPALRPAATRDRSHRCKPASGAARGSLPYLLLRAGRVLQHLPPIHGGHSGQRQAVGEYLRGVAGKPAGGAWDRVPDVPYAGSRAPLARHS